MTHDMQDTERELIQAEQRWLLARGWRLVSASTGLHGGRYAHPAAPAARPDYAARDAIAMTRGEPIRYAYFNRPTGGPA